MSVVRDERVVEMKFDNKQFESGINQSMASLKEFENCLDFTDSVKGFDVLSKAASKVDLSGMSSAIQVVGDKFNWLEEIATGVFRDIGSRISSTIADMIGNMDVWDLTIKQINAGWDKYADKTSSVQTIMAATAKDFTDTGEQMEFVNDQLDKLNWFTDETSYNFVDMTNNIGKFTSNGIKLDKSVEAMQGIATWAAISGANAGEASRAMYNLSQALATGSVKLIDWKSIENANMATAEFKQMAIEAAEAMGTLKKVGADTWTTLDGKQEVTVTNFNEGLSKGWFSSEVLMSTLEKYGGFTTVLSDAMDQMGDYYDTTSQLLTDIDKFAEGELELNDIIKETGMSAEEVSEIFTTLSSDEYELGRRAFKAAQEAKTFAEAIDATKDAVSTGWMNVWQTIFGDYTEAKELWTAVAEELWEVFAAPISNLNDILSDWADFGGRSDLFEGLGQAWENVKEIFEAVGDALKEIFPNEAIVTTEKFVNTGKGVTSILTGTPAKIYKVTKAIKEFSLSVKEFLHEEEGLDKIKRTFKGLFSLLSIGKKMLGSIFSAFTKNSKGVFKGFVSGILDATSAVGDFLVKLDGMLDESGVLETIGERLSGAFEAIKTFISEFFDTLSIGYGEGGEGISGIIGAVLDLFNNFVRTIAKVFSSLTGLDITGVTEKYIVRPIQKVRDFLQDFIWSLKDFSGFKIKAPDLSGVTDFADKIKIRFSPLKDILTGAWEGIKLFFGGLVTFLAPVGNFIKDVAQTIWEALGGMFNRIITLMKEGDFQALFDIINGGLFTALGATMLGFAKDIKNADGLLGSKSSLADTIKGIVDFVKDPKTVFNKIGDGFTSLFGIFKGESKETPDNLKSIATSIGILAGSLFLLATIDSKKLTDATLAITALFADLVGSVKLLTGIELAVSGTVKLAASILIMAFALKTLGSMRGEDLAAASAGILALILELVEAMKAMATIDATKMAGLPGAMIAFAAAMWVMAKAMQQFGKIDIWSMAKGIGGIAASIAGMVVAFKYVKNEDILKVAGAMFVFSESMMRMGIAMQLFSAMSGERMITALSEFAGVIGGMIIAFKYIKNEDIIKVAAALFIFSEAMMRMGIAMQLLGTFSDERLITSLVMFGSAITGMLVAFNYMNNSEIIKTAAAMLIFSEAMMRMGVALQVMGSLGFEKMIISLTSLAAVLGLIYGFSVLIEDPTAILKMSAALSVLGLALIALSAGFLAMSLVSWEGMIKSLVLLAGTLLVLGGAAVILGPSVGIMVALAGALALLGVALTLLGTGLTALAIGIGSTVALIIESAAAILAAIEIILVGVLEIIAHSAEALTEAIVVVFRAIINAILELVPEIIDTTLVVIRKILESLAANAPSIVQNLIIVLDIVLQALADRVPVYVGLLADLIIETINALSERIPAFVEAVVNVVRTFVDAVIASLNGLDTDNLLKGILAFGLTGAMMTILAGLAGLAPAAMVGVLAAAAVITEVALLLAAIGALNQIPGLKWLIDEGGTFLESVGAAIGKFFGSIAGGFLEGVTSQFPKMADDLSQFMINLQPFLDGANSIQPGVLEGIASIAGAILALTGADIVKGIAEWVTGNEGTSLSDFGAELNEFAPYLMEFADKTAGIDAESVQGAADATKTLAEMASSIPNEGGVLGFIMGENSLSKFGSELALYAPNFVRFANTIAGAEIDTQKIKDVSDATLQLAQMAKQIPNEGGLVAMITGDNSLSEFGAELKKFAPNLVYFAGAVSGLDLEGIPTAVDATMLLVNMARDIPNTGGLVALITGDNSLTDFGKELAGFAPYLHSFATQVKDIDASQVKGAAEASEELVKMAGAIPRNGGLAELVSGSSSLADFGKELSKFGSSLEDYADYVEDIELSQVQGSIDATDALLKSLSAVPKDGGFANFVSGNTSLSKFGEELVAYGKPLTEFAGEVSGKVTSNMVAGAADATERLADMVNRLPKTDGLFSKVMGTNSLAQFGTELAAYGQPLADFAGTVSGVKQDQIDGAAQATERLADMAKAMPSVGGILQNIIGEKGDLGSFGAQLSSYGEPLKNFAATVSGVKATDVDGAVGATKALAQMANDIPETGGLLQKIAGEKGSLSKFGEELSGYSGHLKSFADNVSTISEEKVESAAKATSTMAGIANNLPKNGLKDLIGTNGLAALGDEIEDYGSQFAHFNKHIVDLDGNIVDKTQDIVDATTIIANGIKSNVDAEMLDNVGGALRGFGKDVKKYYDSISGIETAQMNAVTEQIKKIAGVSKDISSINGDGLRKLATGLEDISSDSVSDFMSAFSNSASDVSTAASGMVKSAIIGVYSQKQPMIDTIKSLCESIIQAFTTNLSGKRSTVTNTVRTVCNDIITTFRNSLPIYTFYSIATNVGMGLIQGMQAYMTPVRNTANALAQIVSQAMRNALKIHSPSAETYDIGEYVVAGLVEGMEEGIPEVTQMSDEIGDAAIESLKAAMGTVTDDFANGMDQPVITPVLDMSNIQNGYKSINSMLSNDYMNEVSAKYNRAVNGDDHKLDQLTEAIKGISNDNVVEELTNLRGDISQLQEAIKSMQVVLNSGALVGEIVGDMDAALGQRALINSRGRY